MKGLIYKFRDWFMDTSEKTWTGIIETPNHVWGAIIFAVGMVLLGIAFATYGMLGVFSMLLVMFEVVLYVVGIKLINIHVPKEVRLHTIFLVLTPMILITHQYLMIVCSNHGWDNFLTVLALPIKVVLM